MHRVRSPSPPITPIPRSYLVLLSFISLLIIYWLFFSNSSTEQTLTNDSHLLPVSSMFTYLNISSQIILSESQGVLFVPPHDKSGHFGSIKSRAVRGNHRHKDNDNSVSGEVIVLLHGIFQFRIGDGDTNKYEDHRFDISKTGIIALQFKADQCHALKNIGKETNWFGSYYIKSKDVIKPIVDKDGCKRMLLT